MMGKKNNKARVVFHDISVSGNKILLEPNVADCLSVLAFVLPWWPQLSYDSKPKMFTGQQPFTEK